MDKDLKGRDIRTLINVFAEGCIEDHPSIPFESEYGNHVHLAVDYYPHAVDLRTQLVANGFNVSEVTSSMYGLGPTTYCTRVTHDMELELKSKDECNKLREFLDSGIYNITFE